MTVTPVRTLSPLIERGVPDANAGDIGDRVERSGREHARRQADLARARPSASCADERRDGRPDDHERSRATCRLRHDASMIRFSRSACGRFRSTPSTTPREHVYQAAVRTPLIRLDLPFATADGPAPEIYLKLESLQPIGSFKIRGAWNAVRQAVAGAAAGRRVDGERRQRRAGRGVRRAAAPACRAR